jgi:nucleotide-binding universal stress UspA family protein
MTIKRILALPVDQQSRNGVFDTALHIARSFGAHMDIAFVKHIPLSYADTAGDEMSLQITADLLQSRNEDLEEIESELRALFDSFVETNNITVSGEPTGADIPTASWLTMEGHPADAIGKCGGAYDLIVTGKPEDSQSMGQLTTESAMFATGRPVIIAPPDAPPHIGETVLIAWNRGAQAARAFHAAKALLLDRAQRVRILSITTGAKQGPPAAEVAANLKWHGIDADVVELSPDYRSVGEVLLAEASAINADLLVMGAFSHSRLRQLILGGVTRHVFDHAELPVLMAH